MLLSKMCLVHLQEKYLTFMIVSSAGCCGFCPILNLHRRWEQEQDQPLALLYVCSCVTVEQTVVSHNKRIRDPVYGRKHNQLIIIALLKSGQDSSQ